MQKKKLLSVVIPIGNFEKDKEVIFVNLEENARENIEFILILDSQPEESAKCLQDFLSASEEINSIVLLSFGRNPGHSRNIGLKKARGDWIVFADSDDFIFVDNILNSIQSTNAHAVIGEYLEVNKITQDSMYFAIPHDQKLRMKLTAMNPGIWRWVFNRKAIVNLQFPPLSMGEDQLFISGFLATDPILEFKNQKFYKHFSGNPSSLTGSKQNIGDLNYIIRQILILSHSKGRNKFMINLMAVKISLTLIKYGNYRSKLIGLIGMSQIFIRTPWIGVNALKVVLVTSTARVVK